MGREVSGEGFLAEVVVVTVGIMHHGTQAEGRCRSILPFTDGNAGALRPAGKREGFPGGALLTDRNHLADISGLLQIARDLNGVGAPEAGGVVVADALRLYPIPVVGVAEAAVQKHIVIRGTSPVLQLSRVGIDRSLAVNQNLDGDILCGCQHEGGTDTDVIVPVALGTAQV